MTSSRAMSNAVDGCAPISTSIRPTPSTKEKESQLPLDAVLVRVANAPPSPGWSEAEPRGHVPAAWAWKFAGLAELPLNPAARHAGIACAFNNALVLG